MCPNVRLIPVTNLYCRAIRKPVFAPAKPDKDIVEANLVMDHPVLVLLLTSLLLLHKYGYDMIEMKDLSRDKGLEHES